MALAGRPLSSQALLSNYFQENSHAHFHASRPAAILGAVTAAALLTACGSIMGPSFNQSRLPATIQVPTGNKMAMGTVGTARN